MEKPGSGNMINAGARLQTARPSQGVWLVWSVAIDSLAHGPEDIADFETDALAGFVLARASAGLADAAIRGDVGHLEQVRTWFGRPL
ncbi:hypothetical protein [Catellatospora chokoriensis]|uniref:Uncharacterized protein n=1 Tax=Catellatospora chokoriensis TaxID=310353 RepID=A0A8J3JZE5_9ACTN|nr:hypothetical protein [Catellatospora chokoriensis]GIF93887.1 hypothetical protein Cch02nite_73310 [Catellatospora chokoriensis]